MRKATDAETEVARDEAQVRSITTGEVLREKSLCPAVLIRTRDAGVHVGFLASYTHRGGSPLGVAELLDGRRLWWWNSTSKQMRRELHAVAAHGVPKAKISEPLSTYTVSGVCEVLPLSGVAAANLLVTRWED